jgi:hypothetical protein
MADFPLIKDVDSVLTSNRQGTNGGIMTIKPPSYVLAVTNPADSGDQPADTVISAQGTLPAPVAENSTIVFVGGVQQIPGPPGPTGPRGPAGNQAMPAPITLAIAGSAVSIDASTPPNTVILAPIYYRLTLTEANVFMRNPTGMVDSQRIIIELIQDAIGNRTVTWDSAFGFGIDIASAVPTTTPGKRDFVAWVYSNGKWDCVGFTNGY